MLPNAHSTRGGGAMPDWASNSVRLNATFSRVLNSDLGQRAPTSERRWQVRSNVYGLAVHRRSSVPGTYVSQYLDRPNQSAETRSASGSSRFRHGRKIMREISRIEIRENYSAPAGCTPRIPITFSILGGRAATDSGDRKTQATSTVGPAPGRTAPPTGRGTSANQAAQLLSGVRAVRNSSRQRFGSGSDQEEAR